MSSVYNYFVSKMNDDNRWDDIDAVPTEDFEGNKFFIVGTPEDYNILVSSIVDILELDNGDSLEDWEVEEALGVEIVYSDEYTTCSDCHCIIRTSPDSYHWKPDYYLGDGFIVCSLCFEENGYIESYIEERVNNPDNAINGLVNKNQIEELGFCELNEEFELGYYGRNDNPHEIYEQLSSKYDDILFFVDSVGQFSTNFIVFVRDEIDCEENAS